MSCLDATFTLTPQSPIYSASNNYAWLYCWGADFESYSPTDLSSLYASNRFFFNGAFACNPNLDYTQWSNRKQTRFLYLSVDLQSYAAANKQLALIFGFAAAYRAIPGRLLVYSNAGLLKDQQLIYEDNQFLLEIESLDQVTRKTKWLTLPT
jgi:hypothetical protein